MTPATEARLREAVATSATCPTPRRRTWPGGRSGAIGFVVPEISNPYFGAIADHVVEAVERRGLLVLLCSTRSQAVKEASYIDLLASGAIDGMLYLGSFRSNERLAAAIRGGLPVVVVDEPIAGLPDVHTRGDGRLRGRVPGGQLPGRARPPPDRVRVRPGRARLGAGAAPRLRAMRWSRAASTRKQQLNLAGAVHRAVRDASALPRLLAGPEPPTAAFVASDYIALGMLSAAETHGIRVPEDLSVVGFDDIRFSQYVRPRLTTIRSPVERLAQTGVAMLFERLGAGTPRPGPRCCPWNSSSGSPRARRVRERGEVSCDAGTALRRKLGHPQPPHQGGRFV